MREHTRADRNGDGQIEFEEEFHRTYANVAIKDGLFVAAESSGLVDCIDAKTGRAHWTHDCLASIYASPLIVEDKAYVGDEDGDVHIFQLSSETP